MTIAELATKAGYSVDQARRRLNMLVEQGVVERERHSKWPGAWEYAPQTLGLLQELKRLEAAGCTCKEAIPIVAARHKGRIARSYSDDSCGGQSLLRVTIAIELGDASAGMTPKVLASVANQQSKGYREQGC